MAECVRDGTGRGGGVLDNEGCLVTRGGGVVLWVSFT